MSDAESPVKCACGSKRKLDFDHRLSEEAWRIKCDVCGRTGPWAESWDDADARWNKDQRALKHFEATAKVLRFCKPEHMSNVPSPEQAIEYVRGLQAKTTHFDAANDVVKAALAYKALYDKLPSEDVRGAASKAKHEMFEKAEAATER